MISNICYYRNLHFASKCLVPALRTSKRHTMTMDATYFYYLLLLSSVSFGGHFAKSTFSMFGLYMINDHVISPAGLGMLLAAAAMPSMIIPFLVGHSVDKAGNGFMITLVLFLFEISGLCIFCVAVYSASFPLAMVGMFVYGIGSSSISVMQRVLVTLFLKDNLSFTTGFYVAFGNIAKLLGKICIAPIVTAMHSYREALVVPVIACAYSLGCYLLFHASAPLGATSGCSNSEEMERNKERSRTADKAAYESSSLLSDMNDSPVKYDSIESAKDQSQLEEGNSRETDACSTGTPTTALPILQGSMPVEFYWLAGIHALYILIFHSLVSFLPHYIYTEYEATTVDAGYIASVPYAVIIIMAPCVGIIVDRVGKRNVFCAAAAVLTTIAYAVLIFTSASPYLKMALISIPQGLIPVLTLAEISSLLPPHLVGFAFGLVSVLDHVLSMLGNVVFGWLYNLTGSYHVGIMVLLLLSVVGLICMVYVASWELKGGKRMQQG